MRAVTPALRQFLLEVLADSGPCTNPTGKGVPPPGWIFTTDYRKYDNLPTVEALERKLVIEYPCGCHGGTNHFDITPLGRMALTLPCEGATEGSMV